MTFAHPSAPATALPPEAFVEEVRAALDHLYDSAFLHTHPLAWRLCGEEPTTGVNRAQRLRTFLLDAIEQLRPQGRPATDAMRAYAILTYRCMDSLSMDEIAAKLGLSRRQAYREYAKGVEAVANFAWDAVPPQATVPAQVIVPAQATVPPVSAAAAAPLHDGAAAPGDAAAMGLATRLDAAAQEVARLTTNLLPETVDFAAVVNDVVRLLAPRTQQTGVAFHIAPQAAQLAVVADRGLLRQALLNLFSFALDQAQRDGKVDISWLYTQASASLTLATDAAAPPAKREGIGVSVAQKLIEAMGGQAQVGQGASEWRCTLALPAAQRDTVLVVDDNADLTALIQRYAASHHLNVVGASSGRQAIALAAELHPQLILLDLMLPQMDGWEILQQMRNDAATRSTPIVICSVLNEADLAYSLGASDYVTKPISQTTLVDVLQRWLGKQHPAA